MNHTTAIPERCSRCGGPFENGETRYVGWDGDDKPPRVHHARCEAEAEEEWRRRESRRLLDEIAPMIDPTTAKAAELP